MVRAIDRQITGKFYWEVTCGTFVGASSGVGIANGSVSTGTNVSLIIGGVTGIAGLGRGGILAVDGTSAVSGFGVIAGLTVCLALDCSARLLWVRLGAAGNWNNSASANPATGIGGVAIPSLGGGIPIYPALTVANTNDAATANFGDTAFTGTVPSGFTSGFPAGAAPGTNALATQVATEEWIIGPGTAQVTQVAVEEWVLPSAQAQLTQLALEQWGGGAAAQLTQLGLEQWVTGSASTQAILTQLGLEQWAVLPSVATGGAGQTAVTVVT